MRRPSDRIEAAALVMAVLLSLAALPLASFVGGLERDHSLAVAAHETASRWSVVGTVMREPDRVASPVGNLVAAKASVAWTTPDGIESRGTVTVPSNARRGSKVTVWTTPDGRPTTPPLTSAQVSHRASGAAVGTQLAVMAILWFSFVGLKGALVRSRYRAWDAEWRKLGSGADA